MKAFLYASLSEQIEFSQISISYLIGINKLFDISQTIQFVMINGNFDNITTYSIFIFEFLTTELSFSNLTFSHFYPQLIYASHSSMNITNCYFTSSFEKIGHFEISAIFFEYNMTFFIKDCQFIYLVNSFQGAVINIF